MAKNRTSASKRVIKRKLRKRDGENCHICGTPVVFERGQGNKDRPDGWSIDHVIPKSRGGLDVMDNMKLAHVLCNNKKGSK